MNVKGLAIIGREGPKSVVLFRKERKEIVEVWGLTILSKRRRESQFWSLKEPKKRRKGKGRVVLVEGRKVPRTR